MTQKKLMRVEKNDEKTVEWKEHLSRLCNSGQKGQRGLNLIIIQEKGKSEKNRKERRCLGNAFRREGRREGGFQATDLASLREE